MGYQNKIAVAPLKNFSPLQFFYVDESMLLKEENKP